MHEDKPAFLEPNKHLNIEGAQLLLKVNHICGTCHIYLVQTDKVELADLVKDVTVLSDMAGSCANFGYVKINDRKYYAVEVHDSILNNILYSFNPDMPKIDLPKSTPVTEVPLEKLEKDVEQEDEEASPKVPDAPKEVKAKPEVKLEKTPDVKKVKKDGPVGKDTKSS